MEPQPESESVAVVLVGAFHPGIIQPSWLAKSGLISDAEAESADISAISNDVSQFSTAWFTVQALPNRFAITTQLSAYFGLLKDLITGALLVLPAIEVAAFGINHDAHFKLQSKEKWDDLGHRIVPKKFWTTVMSDPGTANVTIQGPRPDSHSGHINLTFGPSVIVVNGVALGSNDHYDLASSSESRANAESVAALIKQEFNVSLRRSENYFKKLLEYADSTDSGEGS